MIFEENLKKYSHFVNLLVYAVAILIQIAEWSSGSSSESLSEGLGFDSQLRNKWGYSSMEEHLLCKQRVLGSIPSFSTNLNLEMVVVIENKLIPFKGFKAINLFGVIFVRKGARMTSTDFNHEAIHTAQMKELGYVFFYVLYVIEWLYRLCKSGNAYRNISFEREAYENEDDVYYLYLRKHYAQWRK